MQISDAELDGLRTHRPALDERADFDAFWATTLAEADAYELAPTFVPTDLRDDVSPPVATFAAYNHWQGPKDIVTWPWNRHEGGSGFQVQEDIRYLAKILT